MHVRSTVDYHANTALCQLASHGTAWGEGLYAAGPKCIMCLWMEVVGSLATDVEDLVIAKQCYDAAAVRRRLLSQRL